VRTSAHHSFGSLFLQSLPSPGNHAVTTLVLTAVLLAGSSITHAAFGPVTDLSAGSEPHCALGPGGTLHVVFVNNNTVGYMTVDGAAPLAVETLPGSSAGRNPFICVGTDGSVHVVWDTWSTAYYSNRVGGTWKQPRTLPITFPERNYFAQVAAAADGTAFTSHWSLTKGQGGHNVFCRVTDVGSSTPMITKIYQESADSRPPSIIAPSPASAGDGNIHIFIGLPQTTHRIMNSSGGVTSGVNISRTPYEKTVEGMQGFFVGTDPAIATAWWDRVVEGAVVNTRSRANAGKQGLIAGTGSPEFPYPRAAYDPVRDRVYILYPKSGKAALALWNPQEDSIQQLGNVSESNIPSNTRGPGAGGIAVRQGGGVHIVYSTGGRLNHRTMDAAPDDQPPSVPTNVQATALSWSSISVSWTASTDNVGVAGYRIYRNASPEPVGTSPTTSFTDSGLEPDTTYAYRVSAYDAAQNESGQSAQAAATTLIRYAIADFDQDGDVDVEDFGRFQACYTGGGSPQVDPDCQDADLNGDSIVDQLDFIIFQSCISGPDRPADPNCGG
jgi:hypothetical protein